ncbi:MAG: 50S ribosomal protein L17 [Candidatus Liptonbacteria bacterium]|nr:50S ribosomal protein L17 [Candidatus Liptonbacteria bacterium]
MRHGKEGKKFHRERGQRKAFMRSLMNALIKHGKMETTETRAKAVKPLVEKAVTMAKKKNLASRRLLIARLHDRKVVQKLCDEIADKYATRKGGYLRITKLAKVRKRDGTRLVSIEFV